MQLDKITHILTLRNRENYINRTLELYKNTSLKVVVADSSKKPSDLNLTKNIKYFYKKDLTIIPMVLELLKEIDTKYVILNSDDDYILPEAIEECVLFLENNNDYVAVQGEAFAYRNFFKSKILHIGSNDFYMFKKNNDFLSDDIKKRFEYYKKNYQQIYYAVMRKDDLFYIFKQMQKHKIEEFYMVELIIATITHALGKSKIIKTPYIMRESMKVSDSHTCTNIESLYKSKHTDINKFQIMMEDVLIQNSVNKKDAKKISKEIIPNFLSFVNEKYPKYVKDAKSHKAQEFVKKFPQTQNIIDIIKKYNINSGFTYKYDKNIKLAHKLNDLEQNFKKITKKHKKIVIYGGGLIAHMLASIYKENIAFIVDQNQNIKTINNIKVFNMQRLKKEDYDAIYISVLGRKNEILEQIEQLNLNAKIYSY